MDREYLLGRKRAELAAARSATHSQARLIHYDLAGRYSLQAAELVTKIRDQQKGGSEVGQDEAARQD